MADITMCDDESCPSKEKCYRYMAPVNPYRQSYFMFSPMNKDGVCPEFNPIYNQKEEA